MKLDLVELKNRCLRAERRGWAVASAASYVAALEEELGGKLVLPRGVRVGSPAHLVALIGAVQNKGDVPVVPPKAEPVPAPEPVEVELADEPEPEEGEELEVMTYEEMSYDELVAEVRERDLPGRSGKNKAELLEMLQQDDEA